MVIIWGFCHLQEECQSLRRKVERYKRMELASSADEVLAEEIRTYKVSMEPTKE